MRSRSVGITSVVSRDPTEASRFRRKSASDSDVFQPPLIRRSRAKPEERAYYFVFATAGADLTELAGMNSLAILPP